MTEAFNFTKKLAELEEITSWLESDKVDLDQALVKFERGMELAAELKDHLSVVENRVEKIKAKFETSKTSVPVDEPEPEGPASLFT
jgi:exodeoxyribonuclease VII small subunit